MAIPRIKFSDDFFEQPQKDQVEYLIKLASSLNDALEKMQDERNSLLATKDFLNNSIKNSEKALDIQKEIVRKTITDANESRNNLSEKIRLLEDRVRAQDTVIEELNNGDIS
jgi:uncharacterized protein (DUF2344 family)